MLSHELRCSEASRLNKHRRVCRLYHNIVIHLRSQILVRWTQPGVFTPDWLGSVQTTTSMKGWTVCCLCHKSTQTSQESGCILIRKAGQDMPWYSIDCCFPGLVSSTGMVAACKLACTSYAKKLSLVSPTSFDLLATFCSIASVSDHASIAWRNSL